MNYVITPVKRAWEPTRLGGHLLHPARDGAGAAWRIPLRKVGEVMCGGMSKGMRSPKLVHIAGDAP
jgi:hypothetical protein